MYSTLRKTLATQIVRNVALPRTLHMIHTNRIVSQRYFSTEPEKKGLFSRIVGFFQEEAKNINEVTKQDERVPKRRLLDRSVKPHVPPELIKAEEAAAGGKPEPEYDEFGNEIKPEEEEPEWDGPNDVTVTKDGRTVWRRRIEDAKENLRSSEVYRKLNRSTQMLEHSENPTVQKLVDLKYDLQDKIDDMKDAYEMSNNTVISTVRRVEDIVTSESEQAFAKGELFKIDPNYKEIYLIEDLEQYMIPVVVSGFFRGDLDIMRSVMGDQALDAVTAAIKERMTKKQFWDDTILDIRHLEVQEYNMVNFEPVITVQFICQQLHCIKDHKDKIVEGSPSEIRSVFYLWTLKRDLYNPDFDWKIIDFKYQPMLQLA